MLNHFKKVSTLVIAGIAITIAIVSCKKDLEINTDYKAYPIVYAFLNPYDSVQTFRIQKSFLGETNPKGYAKIQDSSKYDEVNVDLIELVNGNETARYQLTEETITNKEEGTFSSPNQTVYVAKTNIHLTENARFLNASTLNNLVEYRLEGNVVSKGVKTNLKGTSNSINKSTKHIFLQPAYRTKWKEGNVEKMSFATSRGFTKGLEMVTELPRYTKVAEVFYIFHYIEIDLNGNKTNKSLRVSLGNFVIKNPDALEEKKVVFTLKSQRFFELIATLIPDIDRTKLKARKASYSDFEVILGNEEFHYYRINTLPSNDLNQLRPKYTNIENAFGSVSWRTKMLMTDWVIDTEQIDNTDNPILSTKTMKGLLLDKNTQIALYEGEVIVKEKDKDITVNIGTQLKGFCMDKEVVGNYNCGTKDCLCP